jgi:ribosomal protein S18 acetylase RimI-like enzyme
MWRAIVAQAPGGRPTPKVVIKAAARGDISALEPILMQSLAEEAPDGIKPYFDLRDVGQSVVIQAAWRPKLRFPVGVAISRVPSKLGQAGAHQERLMKQVCSLTLLAVKESQRHQGIGQSLVRAATTRWRYANFVYMIGKFDASDDGLVEFYRLLGAEVGGSGQPLELDHVKLVYGVPPQYRQFAFRLL